jgi:outer membrane biosynthesis protein TonB
MHPHSLPTPTLMRRSLFAAVLFSVLFVPSLSAQGTKDSTLVRANKADLDSIARDKTAPGYSKRAQSRIRVRDSLFLVRAVTPAPAPAPAPEPKPVPAPTPTPEPKPVPAPTPAPEPAPAPAPAPTPSPTPNTGPVIFTHPYAPPTNGAAFAELPRDTVSVAVPAPTRTITVVSLQAAYDTAQTGDRLLIPRTTVTSPTFGLTRARRMGDDPGDGLDERDHAGDWRCGERGQHRLAAHHIRFLGPLTITTRPARRTRCSARTTARPASRRFRTTSSSTG